LVTTLRQCVDEGLTRWCMLGMAWHGINVDGGLVNLTDDADVGLLTGWREVGVALNEVVALGAVGGIECKGFGVVFG